MPIVISLDPGATTLTPLLDWNRKVQLYRLPKMILRGGVEHVHSAFNGTVTKQLSHRMLAVLLWLLTGITPNTNLH